MPLKVPSDYNPVCHSRGSTPPRTLADQAWAPTPTGPARRNHCWQSHAATPITVGTLECACGYVGVRALVWVWVCVRVGVDRFTILYWGCAFSERRGSSCALCSLTTRNRCGATAARTGSRRRYSGASNALLGRRARDGLSCVPLAGRGSASRSAAFKRTSSVVRCCARRRSRVVMFRAACRISSAVCMWA